MYNIIFIPYRGMEQVEPVTLIERVACLHPPHASDIPWLLREEGIYLTEQGAVLIVGTSDACQICRAYWYDPRHNTSSPLPCSTPAPQISEEIASFEAGERTKRRRRRIIDIIVNLTVKGSREC